MEGMRTEVMETGLTTKTKIIIGGVAGFVLILTTIIFKLLKKNDDK